MQYKFATIKTTPAIASSTPSIQTSAITIDLISLPYNYRTLKKITFLNSSKICSITYS